MKNYSLVRVKISYKEKLAKLAKADNRSMSNMLEVLIDKALAELEKQSSV